MKKYLFTIAAVAFALCACQKAETGTNEVTPGVNEEVGAPQQILIGTNLKSSELVTKASVDEWTDQTVYVIGYDNAKIGTATEVSEGEVFIMANIPGTVSPNADDHKKGTLDFGGNKFYYNEGVDSYDFVGYYLGEEAEEATATVSEGLLTVPFTINGQDDVLAANTDRDNDRWYEESRGVSNKYLYSAFASRKGVTPTLVFNHMLTKFSFNVKYGSETGADEFKLLSIGIETKSNGTLLLNPMEGDAKVKPYVVVSDEAEIQTLSTDCTDFSAAEATTDHKPAGYLMVMPGEETYNMILSYEQEGTDDETHYHPATIEIGKVQFNDPDATREKFMPGEQYNVNITVYGLEKIEVNVELVPWVEVGSVEIDPDAEKEADEEGIVTR